MEKINIIIYFISAILSCFGLLFMYYFIKGLIKGIKHKRNIIKNEYNEKIKYY